MPIDGFFTNYRIYNAELILFAGYSRCDPNMSRSQIYVKDVDGPNGRYCHD